MQTSSPTRLMFQGFEVDLRTRELRRDGQLVKLQDLPVRLLALLASRPGALVTREEIEKALWPEGEFVDFEHGINTAMRKIREALGEDPERPRFIETLPRKGYRFIAAVEPVGAESEALRSKSQDAGPAPAAGDVSSQAGSAAASNAEPVANDSPERFFLLPRRLARGLFLITQAGYLAMYCAALYRAEATQEVLTEAYGVPAGISMLVLAIAICGIPVRLYLLTSVGLDHPAAGDNYRRIFPILFTLDAIWAASPLLLVRKIGLGLTLAAAAALAYLPFVQRTLMASCYKAASK